MHDQFVVRAICKTWHWLIGLLILGGVASIVALYNPGLYESYTLRSFVGASNPAFDEFQSFMDEFSGSELTLIAVRSQDALDDRAIACLRQLTGACTELDAVNRVRSIASLPALGRSMWIRHPLIDGLLISHDRKTAGILVQMLPEAESGDLRADTVAALRAAVTRARADYADFDIILTGPYVTMYQMFELVHRDMTDFSLAICAIMIIALAMTVGSWRAATYALSSAIAATLCTLGITAFLQINVSLLMQTTIILITALTVASCVHVSMAFQETVATGLAPPGIHTLRRMLAPVTAVIVTTAAGFAAVTLSDIQPIRTFGAIMVCGLGIALVATLVGLLALKPTPQHTPRSNRATQWILSRAAGLAIARPRSVIALFIMGTAILAAPIPFLRFESKFVENFRAGSSVRQGYEFVEAHLAPLSSIELVVRPRGSQPLINLHTVRACEEVTSRAVEKYDAITKSLSVVDLLRGAGQPLPSSETDLQARLSTLSGVLASLSGEDPLRVFTGRSGQALRISLLAREGTEVNDKLITASTIQKWAVAAFGDGYTVELTGLYYFYATLMAGLVEDQYRTFGVSAIAVFIVSAMWLRSGLVGLLAMVPNIVTILASLGLMGWLRIPINMATAMMLSIALGIAIDDTIHYLWRVRRDIADMDSLAAAIHASHLSVGRACLFTTIVLALGFWVLCFSRFLPMAYFGAIIGLSMLCALAADLLLLPALLVIARKPVSAWATRTTGRRV